MINVKCDMCKCNIDYNLNGINLDFNHFGDVKMLCGEEREYQLCNVCASKVHEFIERGVENDRAESNRDN